MKYAKKKMIFYIILGIAAFILVFSLLTFLLYLRPTKYVSDITPADFGLDYENVSFKTSDGLTLSGWFIPSDYSNSTIVVGHGFPFDKGNILQITEFLNKHYNLFYYDYRYFGESQGSYTTIALKEQQDFLSALEYLKKREDVDKDKIGAIGFSLSAPIPILANSLDVKAIVSDSSYASLPLILKRVYFIFPYFLKYPFIWTTAFYTRIFLGINIYSLSPLEKVKSVNVPILFIHGSSDSQIPAEHSMQLYKNAKNSEIWIVEGADHGQSYSLRTKEYEKKVIDFFDKYLL